MVGGDGGDEWEEVLLLCVLVMRWDGNTDDAVGVSYMDCGLESWQQPLDREWDCGLNAHSSLAICVLQDLSSIGRDIKPNIVRLLLSVQISNRTRKLRYLAAALASKGSACSFHLSESC